MTTAQQVLGTDGYEKYRQHILERESAGNGGYQAVNQLGFMGGYQMGVPALKDVGLIKSTAPNSNSAADNASNWTIPGGKQAFLNNPALQDQAFRTYTDQNLSTLRRIGVVNDNTSTAQVAGYLGASHLVGPGDVKKNRDLSATDANGVQAKSYFDSASAAVSGKAAAPSTPSSTPGARPATEVKPSQPFTGEGIQLEESRVGNEVVVSYTEQSQDNSIGLPLPNPLRDYASFTTIVTLSSITTAQFNNPETSYKAGNIGKVICRSGGTGDLGPSLAATTSDNSSGKYEFFIGDFEFTLEATHNRMTLGSNLTDMQMTIIEPYSMGLLFQALEIAARENGHSVGYIQSPFLITLEFIGWDDDGNPRVIENTTRHLPIHLSDMEMEVSGAGSKYTLKAYAYNERVLDDMVNVFKTDIAISGSTVQEILQSGEFSLQSVVNKRIQELSKKEKSANLPDEILIVFPKILQSSNNSVVDNVTPDDIAVPTGRFNTATPDDIASATVSPSATQQPNTLKVTRGPTSLITQEKNSLNELGASAMDFDMTLSGDSTQIKSDVAQDDPEKGVRRKAVQFDPKSRMFVFAQGTTMINAISNVMINSAYCKNAIEKSKTDPAAMIPWFRIETSIFIKDPIEGNLGKNRPPMVYIYKVVPYKVHSSKYNKITAKPKGLEYLKAEAAKVYDYIYSGKNEEVLNFNMNFNVSFATPGLADRGLQNAINYYSTQFGAGTNTTTPYIENNEAGAVEGTNGRIGVESINLDSLQGGTTASDHRTLVAQMFNKALLDDGSQELVQVDLEIQGDPYFIADSGIGNFSNTGSGRFNVTSSNAVDYQSGTVHILLNFRTPIDYGPDGIMEFGNTDIVKEFSGLYEVFLMKSSISRGKFTQILTLGRVQNQTAEPQTLSNNTVLGAGANTVDRTQTDPGEIPGVTVFPSGQSDTGAQDLRATANPNDRGPSIVLVEPVVTSSKPLTENSQPENTFDNEYIAP